MPIEIPPSTFAFRIMRKLQEVYGNDPGGTEMELSAYPDPWCPDSDIIRAITPLIEEELGGTMKSVTIPANVYESWRQQKNSAAIRLQSISAMLTSFYDADESNVLVNFTDINLLTTMCGEAIEKLSYILRKEGHEAEVAAAPDGDLLEITRQRDELKRELDIVRASNQELLSRKVQNLADLNGLEHQVSQLKKQLAAQANATSRAYQVVAALGDLQARAEEFASDIGELLAPQEEPQAAPVAVTAPPLLQLGLEDPAEEQSVAAFISQTIAANRTD